MSDFIRTGYTLTKQEKSLVDKSFVTHTDWGKEIFDDIKRKIIPHLRAEQDNKCCYCKRKLGFDIREVEIEHIIPKSTHLKFAFHSRNLALSCPGCNTKKSTKAVLNGNITSYPRTSEVFKIVHAHYDSYPEHIRIDNESVYIAQSSKGSETITICELFRLNIVEANMKKFTAGKQSVLAQLTEAIRTGTPEELTSFIEEIKQLL